MENYVFLRNLVVCRLTLYNARRGDEGVRLRTKYWKDAKDKIWIREDMMEFVTDPAEKFRVNQYLLTYLERENFVPILIPNDCVKTIDTLVAQRTDYGICLERVT